MSAAYRASVKGGNVVSGAATATITPAVGDLFIVFAGEVVASASAASSVTDNNGGHYLQVTSEIATGSIGAATMWVRTQFLPNTTSTVVTFTPAAVGAYTGAEFVVIAVSGMSRNGLNAIRQSAVSDTAASGTPATTFGSACLTGNVTIAATMDAASSTVTTAPSSWTSRQSGNPSGSTAPGVNVATRDSGFTGTTITWGGTATAASANISIELDGSASAFSVDGTSGWAVPKTDDEWTTLLSGSGIPNPTSLWLFQEASGKVLDYIGGVDLSTSGSINYAESVSGWTRKSIGPTANGANYLFNNTSSNQAGGGNQAYTWLGLVAISATPAGDRDVALIGDTNGMKAMVTSSDFPKVVINASGTPSTATGSGALGTGVRPWILATDGTVTPTFNDLRDDLENLTPGTVNCNSASNQIFLGGVVETAAAAHYLLAAEWKGTGLTNSQRSTLITLLKNVTMSTITAGAGTSSGAFTASALFTSAVTAGAGTASGSFSDLALFTGVITAGAGTSSGMFNDIQLTSITITASSSGHIPGGGSVQMTAIGTYSDMSMRDLTSLVTWASSDPSVLSIDSSGVAVAGFVAGTATITATL